MTHETRFHHERKELTMHADFMTNGDGQRTQVGPDPLDYVLRYTDAVADGTVGNRANCVACRLAILSIGTRCKCKCGRCHFHSVRYGSLQPIICDQPRSGPPRHMLVKWKALTPDTVVHQRCDVGGDNSGAQR